MSNGVFKKKGQVAAPAKNPARGAQAQLVSFGEVVRLPGGLPASRQFTHMYRPGEKDTEGETPPLSSLADR